MRARARTRVSGRESTCIHVSSPVFTLCRIRDARRQFSCVRKKRRVVQMETRARVRDEIFAVISSIRYESDRDRTLKLN